MHLIMEIGGKRFIDQEFDFIGKDTQEERDQYVHDIRLVLETEYEKEISKAGGIVQFYYHAKSKSDYMKISAIEMKAFEIHLNRARYKFDI